MKINWKWPKTPQNDFLPWYNIAWNLLWVVPFFVGRIIYCAAGAMMGLAQSLGPSFLDLWEETK